MADKQKIKKYALLLGVLFLFPIALIVVFGRLLKHNFDILPYFDPARMELVEDSTVTYSLPPFRLTNQFGEIETNDSLKGHIWIAAFFSTHDDHLLLVTKRLMYLNFKFADDDEVKLVCFTTDPAYDTPDTLQHYLQDKSKYNSSDKKWMFLTGEMDQLHSLFTEGFYNKHYRSAPVFWLVDGNGQLRGIYDANKEAEMGRAVEDVRLLMKEDELSKKRKSR